MNADKKNYLIGIVAVGERCRLEAFHLIHQINHFINIDILVLTDDMDFFKKEFQNVRTIEYKKEIFSYHSKLEIFKEGFKTHDSVLLLDADHSLDFSFVHYFQDFDSLNLKPGIYPSQIFGEKHICSFEKFCAGIKGGALGDFGPLLVDFCEKESINYAGSTFILEQLFLIKKHENFELFLSTWSKLRNFCEELDLKRKKVNLGGAEGYSIAIAVTNSNMEIYLPHNKITQAFAGFRHSTLTI